MGDRGRGRRLPSGGAATGAASGTRADPVIWRPGPEMGARGLLHVVVPDGLVLLAGRGRPERRRAADVICGSYDVVSLDGSNGAEQWRAPSGDRVWPGVAVADLTGDGTLRGDGRAGLGPGPVYDRSRRSLDAQPLRQRRVAHPAVADLETDGQLEVVVAGPAAVTTNHLNVYEPDGTVRPAGPPARRRPRIRLGHVQRERAVADMNADGLRMSSATSRTTSRPGPVRQPLRPPHLRRADPQGPKIWRQSASTWTTRDLTATRGGWSTVRTGRHAPPPPPTSTATGCRSGSRWATSTTADEPVYDLYYMPFILSWTAPG